MATFNAAVSGSFATGTAASATPTGTFSFATLSTPFDFDASNTAGGLGISQLAGFYGGSSTASQFGAHNGGTTTGGVLDFGLNAGQANAGQRFVGLLDTSSVAPETYFGLGLVNNTGSTISSFNLGFVAALWRQSNLGKTLYFGYEVASPGSSEPTATTPLTGIGSLTFATSASASGGVAIDGTQVANQKTINDTVSVAGGVPQGSDLFLQWYFNDSTGKAQGIGISTLSFSLGSGVVVPPTQTDTWAVGAGSGSWDTSTINWTASGSPTKYTDGDGVIFPDTLGGGSGTINVTNASVTPSPMAVQNNSGTYTIIGNPINGSFTLTKTGNGTLALSPTTSNGYTGGTTINGGQIVIAKDGALGDPSGGVTLNGGSLICSAPITSIRSFSFGESGGTLDIGANASTFGGGSGSGSFTKVGSGDLTFTGAFTSGPLSLGGGNLIFTGTGSTTLAAVTINPGSGTLALPGNVVLSGPVDFAVAGAATTNYSNGLSGNGSILVQSTNTAIHNLKSTAATINNNIVLNSSNSTGSGFTAGDVSQAPFVGGSFVTVLGGATGGSGLVLNGQVSGYSDVVITNDAKTGGGAGKLTINTPATYVGTTVINVSTGQIVSGVNNALPATTDVIIGGSGTGVDNLTGNTNTGTIGAASMDLAGHSQKFSSISDGDAYVVGGTQTGSFSVINTSATAATLTFGGTINPANDWSAGAIGIGSVNNNINLVKGGSNYLVLNNTSTYTGSTTVRGGTLSIGSTQSNQLASSGINESIASTSIALQGIDSHATLALYSSTALANGTFTAMAVTTGGAGVEVDLDYSGQQFLAGLTVNGTGVPNGIYSSSNEPALDPTLFVGSGSVDVVPEPTIIGIAVLATPIVLRRRRRSATRL